MKAVDEGVHEIPEEDELVHEESYKCICKPRWEASWCENHGVEWTFVHHLVRPYEKGDMK